VRVLETGVTSRTCWSPESAAADEAWAEHLAADLITLISRSPNGKPLVVVSDVIIYGSFALLALSWNLKVYLHPLPARNFDAFN
jgi:hypothetical protein